MLGRVWPVACDYVLTVHTSIGQPAEAAGRRAALLEVDFPWLWSVLEASFSAMTWSGYRC